MKKVLTTLCTALLLSSCTISFNSCSLTIGEYNYSKASRFTGASELVLNDNIEKLHLYWVNGEVNISQASDNTFSYSEVSEEEIEFSAFYYLNNDELTIQFVEDGTKKEDYNNLSKKIDIVVPNNIEHIEIDNVNTTINFDEINLEEVEINNVNGNINVNYLKCDDFECDIVNGDIKFNKMDIFDLNLKRVNGDLTINEIVDSKERVDLKVSNVNGEDSIYIKESMGYKVEFDSVSKDFNSDYDNAFEYGNKIVRIDYSSVSGSLNIYKG